MSERKSYSNRIESFDQVSGLSVDRIKALSDGVFAIALTLLVLDIGIPARDQIISESDLANAFGRLTPKLLTYFLSFLTLGIFWTVHTSQFHFVEKSDRNFNWINLFFLLCVTIMPFTTAFLSEFIEFKLAVGVYWLNLFLIGVALFWILRYAVQHNLLKNHLAKESGTIRVMMKRGLIAQSLYAFGALFSFINTYISIAALISVQLFFVFGSFRTLKRRR
ncbi:MAG TPA: TMEM175 family protein [Hanamia sp.]|jgi:uncharacterized membrane protein|nr:TMEM175 family protein [Hanamia sp.]